MIVFVIFLLSCSDSDNALKVVTPEQYRDINRCWLNESNQVSGFLIVTETKERSVAYLHSSLCVVREYEEEPVSGFFSYIGALKISGDNGLLEQKKIISRPLASNAIIPSRLPTSDDTVYYFLGHLSLESKNDLNFYQITSIEKLVDLDIKVQSFIDATPKDRARLVQAIAG